MHEPRSAGPLSLGSMIEVAQIVYGCEWDEEGHVRAWPMRVLFGAVGPEVPVDVMLEGRGHAVLQIDQIVSLIRGLTGTNTPLLMGPGAPPELTQRLMEAGFYVELLSN